MLEWKINIVDKRDRQKMLLSEVEEDVTMSSLVQIGSAEIRVVTEILL